MLHCLSNKNTRITIEFCAIVGNAAVDSSPCAAIFADIITCACVYFFLDFSFNIFFFFYFYLLFVWKSVEKQIKRCWVGEGERIWFSQMLPTSQLSSLDHFLCGHCNSELNNKTKKKKIIIIMSVICLIWFFPLSVFAWNLKANLSNKNLLLLAIDSCQWSFKTFILRWVESI